MLDIILYITIAISFAGIIVIIVRKLPEIASINIETIGLEKTERERLERIKEEMVVARLIEMRKKIVGFFLRLIKPTKERLAEYLRNVIKKFQEVEKRYKKKAGVFSKEEMVVKIGNLIREAEEFVKNASYDLAEKYYLEALSLDFKNVDVYKGLAWLYLEKKQYKEAREALEFILKLNPNYHDAYYGLAELSKRENKIDEAIEFARKSVELSSNNPKSLDFLIEVCIMGKRADLAKSALEQLKLVNPENQKIGEFEERIGALRKK